MPKTNAVIKEARNIFKTNLKEKVERPSNNCIVILKMKTKTNTPKKVFLK